MSVDDIDAKISRIEKDIEAMADEFRIVRANMLTGMVSFAGLQTKERMDDLIEQLGELKARRTEALDAVEKAIFKQLDAGKAEDELASDRKRLNRERGYCENGCNPNDLIYNPRGCTAACGVCGAVYDHRLDNTMEHVAFNDIPSAPRRRGGGYKPPNHFAEIIAQFQGKRRSAAPRDVVDMVGECCRRYGIKKHKITPKVVRMFLKQKQHEEATARKFSKKKKAPAEPPSKRPRIVSKKNKQPEDKAVEVAPIRKYTDYYKHCPEIAWRLSGIPPPYMMPNQEDRIVALFPLVVDAYRSSPRYLTRKADRTNRVKDNPNMLNYLYIMYKLCELLGYTEFLPYIPLPKSLANIDDCDQNGWRHICKTYGWSYTPTTRYS